ncbi:MAG: hypothetical protein ACFB0B_17950 [Thermonemataceae bacterium]
MNYLNFIDEFTLNFFENNKEVTIKDIHTGKKRDFSKEQVDEKLRAFYKEMDGFRLKWNVNDDNPDNYGSINILKTKDAFTDGVDLVYFDHTPANAPLRSFYIIDFFVDEACVGIYVGQPSLLGMHYFEFENSTRPLHVDFEGYMKLLGATKGFLYWQKVILDHLSGSESFETKSFKEVMPVISPNFHYDQFTELYESLRIDK